MADSRFSALSKDPRYRLPSRKEARTAVDPRFGRLFTDQDFRKKAKVDRYGRKIKAGSGKKELERLYRLDEQNNEDQISDPNSEATNKAVDESNIDEDGEDFTEKRDRARNGGFSESSSSDDSSSDAESDSEAELELAEQTAGQEQTEDIPLGDVSTRIAVVNLDWDNIRAADVMVVASSFIPTGGKIQSVVVYPSEFGRERLEKEEIEGPPKEIFANSRKFMNITNYSDHESESDSDEGEDDEKIKRQLQEDQVNEGDEFDHAKLREYQLERLRYYYAVISCDSRPTAKALYDAMDGREYLSTANFFDMRFIPEETTFDDDSPRDECTQVPDGYRPNEFKTQALTHSKVRLTWDDDDTTRKEVQKRAFSRAEIDENDLQAYIGSDSSDADSATSRKSSAAEKRVAKKEAQRAKMRAALGLSEGHTRTARDNGGPNGDMQITFTSGLSSAADGSHSVFENKPPESTRDQYIRKERERKHKRKEKMKAARNGGAGAETEGNANAGVAGQVDEDQGFNDPFFHDPVAAAAVAKQAKKAERQKKLQAQAELDEEAKAHRAELDLLMAEDKADHMRHFDMREIEKAEKEAKRRGSKKRKNRGAKGVPNEDLAEADGFKVETQDPRFKALFDSHEYAIDPTNPRFKSTTAMKSLLEEGRKKRKHSEYDAEKDEVPRLQSQTFDKATINENNTRLHDGDLQGLVARIKRRK